MASLYIANIAISAKGGIPEFAFEQFFPSSVSSLGQALAQQVQDYVEQNQLGYYPALDYINENQAIAQYLLEAANQVAGAAVQLCSQEVLKTLQPIFSSVKINAVSCLAYAMPRIRPGQSDSLEQLARHYTPNRVKFELQVSLMQRSEPKEGIERAAREMVYRWLSNVFEDFEVTSARFLGAE